MDCILWILKKSKEYNPSQKIQVKTYIFLFKLIFSTNMNKPFLKNRILIWVCPLVCWACPAKQPVEPIGRSLNMAAQLGRYIVYIQNQEKTVLQNVTLELKAPAGELRLDTFQYVISNVTLQAGGRDSFYYEDFVDRKRGGYHLSLIHI
jgi:hypothetical protein